VVVVIMIMVVVISIHQESSPAGASQWS
jgi:hypothetical protein